MITCVLKGGLGNMMFQIAWLKSFSKDYGQESYFLNIEDQIRLLNIDKTYNPSLNYAEEYLSIFQNLNLKENLGKELPTKRINLPFHFVDVPLYEGACYDGFFQSEKYFKHNREYLLKLFEPSYVVKKVLEKYKDFFKETTCSIHVRRGDYLKFSQHHPPQALEYFNQSIDQMLNLGVNTFLVFSDDIKWCMDNFSGKNIYFIDQEKDYVELFLQSMCDHNIISNSSFSWWGAWLNKNVNKKVIGPKKWFGPGKVELSSVDILPESWIKI